MVCADAPFRAREPGVRAHARLPAASCSHPGMSQEPRNPVVGGGGAWALSMAAQQPATEGEGMRRLSWPLRPLPDGRGEVWRWDLATIAQLPTARAALR